MRVLHMIPDIGVANGIMSVILNYFGAMPQDIKFDVCYFSEKEETRRGDIEALGGRVFKIPAPSAKGLMRSDMSRFFATHRGEWQALHIHAPHFAVFIAPQARAAGIKKICCHCHSSVYSLKGNGLRNHILSLYAKYFVKTKFACSESAGRFWYGGKKFTVLKNAVNCREYAFDPAKRQKMRRLLNAENAFAVCHIGKTDIPQKNHPFLLRVFAEICARHPDSRLILIGAEKTDELSRLCRELEIEDRALFLGARSDVSQMLQAGDVFVFPSTKEGLPVSVIEAQASGLPVVMSDSVTSEVVVSDEVELLSLSASPSLWAERVIGFSQTERKNNYEKMKSAGWDIYDCACRLEGYYR